MSKLVIFLLVMIVFISCEEVINVENISNDSVQILAPRNDAVLNDGAISFNWETLSGTDNYQLQIATPNFSNATQIVLDTLLNTNSFVQTLDAELYEWRIRGLNSAYETAYVTTTFKVITDITDSNIVLQTPAADATLAPGAISFTWESLDGAEEYQLQIATPDFMNSTTFVLDTIINTTDFSQNLEANSYKWRVKGINEANETVYTTNNFVVE